MNYFLAVDIGTTATKTVAFSEEGESIAVESISYPILHPQTGWSEQDPDEILRAVVNGVNKVVSALDEDKLTCISFSSVMHSLMAVDDQGKPLTNIIIWADNRAEAIATQLRKSETGKTFYKLTGVPIHAMSPLCKLLWLKENSNETFLKAYRFIGIKEYVLLQLFGECIIDSSVASATGLLNLESLQWDETILKYLALDSTKLPPVVSPTHILYDKKTKQQLLVDKDTPVVVGASDGACANLGSDALDGTTLAITIGTSSAARIIVKNPSTDEHMRTFCYHVNSDQYIVGGGSNSGGVVIQWLKEKVFETDEDYDELFEQANTVAAGSDGLICLPYILGERAPLWDASATGIFFGLAIQHTKAHFIRAAIEGLVFNLLTIAKAIPEAADAAQIAVSGGLAGSSIVMQILADVFNRKVQVKAMADSSAFGAAILAAQATGQRLSRKDKASFSEVLPDEKKHVQYQAFYQKFLQVYDVYRKEWSNL